MLPVQSGRDGCFARALTGFAPRDFFFAIKAIDRRNRQLDQGSVVFGCGLRVRQGSSSLGLTFTVIGLERAREGPEPNFFLFRGRRLRVIV